jgi:diphthamide biosynthesis protein 2
MALKALPVKAVKGPEGTADVDAVAEDVREIDIAQEERTRKQLSIEERLYILADTSYGACCVDEIAAEHVDADVVVHYGRSCLSPTARLPVIYVFTTQPLSIDSVIQAFEEIFPERDMGIILMADITYSGHVSGILGRLQVAGYTNIFTPEVIHNPSSPLPNRTIPPAVFNSEKKLADYQLFHISDPPPALLLTLSSRLQSMYIYPTTSTSAVATDTKTPALQSQTSRLLMRRYALLTSLSTCPIFGILINTLSVKNYLSTITSIQKQIAAAGKKSYTFVVGKVNAAKVANFSEIGGWVVVGCWESSLIESRDFYRPIITPFELNLALQSDEDRLWTGEWRSDFDGVVEAQRVPVMKGKSPQDEPEEEGEFDDEEDSAPPEYDLRTGRYVTHSRPMRVGLSAIAASQISEDSTESPKPSSSNALAKRATGDLAVINGMASPGAEYLRSARTWKGLGSDFETAQEQESETSAAVEEGRSGVARGYTVGEEGEKR